MDLPDLPAHLRQPTGDEGREPVQDRHADGEFARDMPEALCCIATQCPLGFRGVLLSPANSCRECHVIFNHFRPKANSPGGTCVTGRVKGAYSIVWRATASMAPAALAHKRSPPLGCTGSSRRRHRPSSSAGWSPSSLSVLNLWVPRLRLVQPWSSAGKHGCKLRSRGTHIIRVDGLPGDHAEPERRRRILRCEIRLPGRCTPFQPQRDA